MGIRQSINERPILAVVLSAAAAAVGVVFIARSLFGSGSFAQVPHAVDRAFYSDDDGKTWFADDIRRTPPFDHNGKAAVRAMVFRCGDVTFVNYLERITPFGRGQKNIPVETDARPMVGRPAMFEVKKPGADSAWTPVDMRNFKAWEAIVVVQCPNGSADSPVPVYP